MWAMWRQSLARITVHPCGKWGIYGVKGTRSLEKFTIRFERQEERGREDKWEDT